MYILERAARPSPVGWFDEESGWDGAGDGQLARSDRALFAIEEPKGLAWRMWHFAAASFPARSLSLAMKCIG